MVTVAFDLAIELSNSRFWSNWDAMADLMEKTVVSVGLTGVIRRKKRFCCRPMMWRRAVDDWW